MKISFLYIISNGNDLKIGVSKNPEKRLKDLQTGSAQKLHIVETFKLPYQKVFRLEKECHNKLVTSYPKRGEWFKNPIEWDVCCIVESIVEYDLIDS